ncbi:T9SS type A sorting domain-containing protein [candidate division WOR-3 bacterium]|nr:T9SS type A sorting domain-containing protein [candidate division WOR-3 bacterium]
MGIVCLFFLLSFSAENEPQRLVEIPIVHHNEVYKLNKLKITIVDAGSKYVRAILSDEEIIRVEGLGYKVKVIYEDYTQKAKDQLEKDGYHSYAEVITEMTSVAESYPDITFLDTIGYSVEGRLILGLKVSDNANIHEFEPGIRFTGCHHGNEHIATEVVLYLIHWLTGNYSIDQLAKELVDTREIWLIPMVSPDGVYYSTRHNANNVDPNRDYGYMWEGDGNSPSPFSQPETQAMRKNALNNRFVLGFDYHSVATYVNALWDYSPIFSQDDTIMMDIGGEYADSTGYTLIRGWYWYSIHGSCQDAMYGCEGILDYTIETPEPLDPTPVCENNLGAMFRMIQRAGDVGVAGIVTDSVTGKPLNAKIDIEEIHWPIYTDPRLGDYHRVLLPGTYTIKIEANGYETKVIPGVVVSDSITRLDVGLVSNDKYYGHRIVWANITDPNNAYANHTLTCDALGAQDSIFLSIGVSGDVVIDMGSLTDSFAVYEGDDGIDNEGYEVSVSNNWNGPFTSLGIHYGTENFMLLEKVRYVKIVDDGNGNPDTPYAGFDLDGIEAFSIFGCEEKVASNLSVPILCQNTPNPFTQKTEIRFQIPDARCQNSDIRHLTANISLTVHDIAGRLIRTFLHTDLETIHDSRITIHEITWDGKDESGEKVGTGIYFYRLQAGDYTVTRKLTFLK